MSIGINLDARALAHTIPKFRLESNWKILPSYAAPRYYAVLDNTDVRMILGTCNIVMSALYGEGVTEKGSGRDVSRYPRFPTIDL